MDLATGHPREWTLIVKQCVGDLKALWTLSKVPNIGAQMFWERFLRSSWSRYSSETQRHQSRGPKDLIMVDFWLVGLSVKYFDNGSTAKWSGWAQSKHHASPSTIQPSIPIDTEITSGMMALIGVAERAIGRRLPAWSQRSAFHSARARLAAQNLTMPALSPTMTEGSIASWKIKEGESYAAGDVLCEIETDKATMDVEAQEEGIMAKILYADGSKGVKVGTPIAVTAEEGDDLASLEMPGRSPPADATTAAGSPPHPADPTSAAPTKDNNTSHASAAPSASDQPPSPLHPGFSEPAPTARPPKPLLPSVLSLLAQYNLTPADAKSIEATGPQGRLTKGDVLAHLGQIPRSAPSDLTSAIKSREKLDLSNIRMRATGSTDPPAITDIYPGPRVGPAAPEKGSFAEPPSNIEVSLPISLKAVLEVQEKISRSLGIHLPLSTFIARATEIANEDLAVAHGQAPSQNELFDAVLGLDKVKGSMPLRSKGAFMPQMSALPPRRGGSSATAPASRGLSKRSDIFDILAGKKPTASRGPPRPAVKTGKDDASGPLNMFRVMASPRNEKQARTFLERIKTTLEAQPGRLIL